MASEIGRNVNSAEEADTTVSADVSLNTSTTTVIAVANSKRQFFEIHNLSNANDVRLKLYSASVDDDSSKGILLTGVISGSNTWRMAVDNIYVGEISAIAETNSPDVMFVEY